MKLIQIGRKKFINADNIISIHYESVIDSWRVLTIGDNGFLVEKDYEVIFLSHINGVLVE